MNELVEFIEARLAEDVAAVEAVRAHVPRYEHAHHYELALRIARGRASTAIHVPMWERLGTDRVLRGVEAKRRMLAAVEPFAKPDYGTDGEAVAWGVLCALASEWDTHEAYRAEWRP